MHSPAFAIAWQLWTRHRSGIVTALVTLAAMLVASPMLPLVPRMIASSVVLVLVIEYFMNLLLFIDTIGSTDWTYPRRMYALPVPSRALVGWPMLFGGVSVALLWVTWACLVYRPSGFQTPVFVPALGLAAVLLWLQAFAWSPIRNPVLKLCFALTLIPLLTALPIRMFRLWLLEQFDESMRQGFKPTWLDALLTWISEPLVLTLVVTYIAMAYVLARAAIASDRKGDTWRVFSRTPLHAFLAARPAPWRGEFRSPAEAQLWYEWDCHGHVIPIAGPFLVLLMNGAWFFRPSEVFLIPIMTMILIPAVTAGALSLSLGSMRPSWVKSRAFITFLATRPMSSGAMVAAKLRMTALGVLLMFALIGIVIGLWVVAADYTPEAGLLWRLFLTSFPGWRAAAVFVLGALTMVVFTWGQVTACLSFTLTGRDDSVGFNLAGIVCVMGCCGAVIGLVYHPAYLAPLLTLVPWLVAAATVLKLSVASLAFHACLQRGLIGVSSLIAIIAAALAIAGCAIALAALLSAAQALPCPISVALLAIVMLAPLGRFALAVLALEWNRHR